MHSALVVCIPVSVFAAGCGLVLDLDPDDPLRGLDAGSLDAGRPDASGRMEGGQTDATVADAAIPDAPAVADAGVVVPACSHDEECQDGNPCNGLERCEDGACVPGSACDPATPCYTQQCDPVRGCVYTLDDVDGDGHGEGETCGGDCDDTNPAVYRGAPERDDGLDNDCDGSIDENFEYAPCYADDDGDGFGNPGSLTNRSGACGDGEVPIAGDCRDSDSDVYPGQTEFFTEASTSGSDTSWDYDCDGVEEKRWPALAPSCTLIRVGGCARGGWVGSVPDCGEEGTWRDCTGPVGLLCTADELPRVQACR